MVDQLFRFPEAVKRDPAIAKWMIEHPDDLGSIAQYWFEVIRDCGDDVLELMHDGCPLAVLPMPLLPMSTHSRITPTSGSFVAQSWPTQRVCLRALASTCATSKSKGGTR